MMPASTSCEREAQTAANPAAAKVLAGMANH